MQGNNKKFKDELLGKHIAFVHFHKLIKRDGNVMDTMTVVFCTFVSFKDDETSNHHEGSWSLMKTHVL